MSTNISRVNHMSINEIVDRQNVIISIQSDIINELFQLLGQHIAPDELDQLPQVQKINLASEIREYISSTHEN